MCTLTSKISEVGRAERFNSKVLPHSILSCTFSSVQFGRSVVCNSVRPHRRQPTRLPRPWDSPGKNTGVGCHFLLQCMKVKSLSHVRPSATSWTAAFQAPPSMGFSRQEYCSGVPLPSPQGQRRAWQIVALGLSSDQEDL